MRKTLLLVFIHGFKGGDDTFEEFPEHLRVLTSDLLPELNVLSVVYPRFETRGELHDCVARFKEWLQNKVIDLEVAAGTPSPTIDPSVRVVLVGHSMGGIVAAETLLSIVRDEPIVSRPPATSARPGANRSSSSTATNDMTDPQPSKATLPVPDLSERHSSAPAESQAPPPLPADPRTPESDDAGPTFLFPSIQGILAFDTPYLGIHPGVVAHGAEAHYHTASAAYSAYTSASKFFGVGGGGSSSKAASVDAAKALPAAGTNTSAQASVAGGWGRYVMLAGGAAALAAAGAGAYYGREKVGAGWSWVSSHLAFVGCLAKGAELSTRLEELVEVGERNGIGFADFYTRLGEKQEAKAKLAGQLVGGERTFCVVPKGRARDDAESTKSPAKRRKIDAGGGSSIKNKGRWEEAINSKSEDEVTAHRAMFTPRDHPGYYKMSERARDILVSWVDGDWYKDSSRDTQ